MSPRRPKSGLQRAKNGVRRGSWRLVFIEKRRLRRKEASRTRVSEAFFQSWRISLGVSQKTQQLEKESNFAPGCSQGPICRDPRIYRRCGSSFEVLFSKRSIFQKVLFFTGRKPKCKITPLQTRETEVLFPNAAYFHSAEGTFFADFQRRL